MRRFREYKKAFTLVETLLTISIIGIIAVIAVPAVYKNAQEQKTVLHVKKIYATLSTAVGSAYAEYDGDATKFSNNKSQINNILKLNDYLRGSSNNGVYTLRTGEKITVTVGTTYCGSAEVLLDPNADASQNRVNKFNFDIHCDGSVTPNTSNGNADYVIKNGKLDI